MPRIGMVVFASALVVPWFAQSQDAVDFSGTWKMDPGRSESAHQAAPIGPVTLVITQTAAELTLETRTAVKDRSAIANERLTYKLDGSENRVTDKSGTPIVSKAHWEGSSLITETGRNLQGSTVTTRYVLSLDPSGKDLTIHKTLTVQHGYQDPGANNTGTATDVFVKAVAGGRR